MSAVVLPAVRAHWVLQIVVSGFAVLMGLFLIVTWASPLNIVLGVLCVAIFGGTLVGSVRGMRSSGLQLSKQGLTYGSHTFAWSDITGFRPIGLLGKTHVRIQFAPEADLPRNVELAVRAGKFGFNAPSIHIPVKAFDTDGKPLDQLLTRWHTKMTKGA